MVLGGFRSFHVLVTTFWGNDATVQIIVCKLFSFKKIFLLDKYISISVWSSTLFFMLP